MKCLVISTMLLGLLINSNGQITNKAELIEASKKYYNSISNLFVNAAFKYKPSIAEDTTTAVIKCYITPRRQFFSSGEDSGIFLENENEYIIGIKNFEKVKPRDKKYTSYSSHFIYYPFALNTKFFEKLNHGNYQFKTTDSTYLLVNLTEMLEFRKSDYSIRRITNKDLDLEAKGWFFQETIFGIHEVDKRSTINKLEVISKVTQGKSKSIKRNTEMPANAGALILEVLDNPGKHVSNFENFNFSNKKILLDFFYEGCMPCLKAHPVMLDLHNNRDSSYVVIGIDPVLSDTTNLNRYLSKHGINYPVIYGNVASNLAKQLNVTGFPRFIIINPQGEIIFSEFGIGQKNFSRIKQELRFVSKN